jgi:ABC-type lipopolysaccharide export system ATPase subunit
MILRAENLLKRYKQRAVVNDLQISICFLTIVNRKS